jgi:hypothetical protein
MPRIATEQYFASLAQFRTHLPAGKDDELLILKGHLLIERLLVKFLASNLARADRLAQMKPRFAQKLAFASALRADPSDDWLWEAIAALNNLRNELAHQLPNPRLGELRDTFLALVEKSPELPNLAPPPDVHERLHRAIFSLHEAMSHRVDL